MEQELIYGDFEGVSIHDALIFQKAIRTRVNRLNSAGLKAKEPLNELKLIDLTLSVYITEEMRKQEDQK